MAAKRFLNPILKSFICVAGMGTMGLFIHPVLQTGVEWDSIFYVRVVVFLGFSYLLFQSVRQLLGSPEDCATPSSDFIPGSERRSDGPK
jgi:hypothetical protein